jgi:hypothetical protein
MFSHLGKRQDQRTEIDDDIQDWWSTALGQKWLPLRLMNSLGSWIRRGGFIVQQNFSTTCIE